MGGGSLDSLDSLDGLDSLDSLDGLDGLDICCRSCPAAVGGSGSQEAPLPWPTPRNGEKKKK